MPNVFADLTQRKGRSGLYLGGQRDSALGVGDDGDLFHGGIIPPPQKVFRRVGEMTPKAPSAPVNPDGGQGSPHKANTMLDFFKSKGLWVGIVTTIVVIEVYPRLKAMLFAPKA